MSGHAGFLARDDVEPLHALLRSPAEERGGYWPLGSLGGFVGEQSDAQRTYANEKYRTPTC